MVNRSEVLRLILPLVILLYITTALAATPTSFCKCTCFSNSTIIELGPPDVNSISSDFNGGESSRVRRRRRDNDRKDAHKSHALSCTDCNRKFCLDYNLPKCRGAKEEDVFTTCFQRDSRKDEAVVFIFIFATSALLVWAGVRPWAQRWIEAARERRSYIPVSENAPQ